MDPTLVTIPPRNYQLQTDALPSFVILFLESSIKPPLVLRLAQLAVILWLVAILVLELVIPLLRRWLLVLELE